MGATQSGAAAAAAQYQPGMPVDPYMVLDIPHNFTWEQLKAAYKHRALYVHPDKPGGSHELFNLVTECFKKLAIEFKEREANKPHYELKQASRDYYAAQGAGIPLEPPTGPNPFQSAEAFNQFFESNRFEDPDNDHGYGDKMAASTKAREDFKYKKIFSTKKFDANEFNAVFEKEVKPAGESAAIIKYREPEALAITRKIAYTELGGGRPDDYSSSVDITAARQGLQYTDYMKAHTTTRLVDPRTVEQRREYKNTKEYERARERAVKKAMTAEEAAYRAEQERAKEESEAQRVQRLQSYDHRLKDHHERLQQLTIGWRGGAT